MHPAVFLYCSSAGTLVIFMTKAGLWLAVVGVILCFLWSTVLLPIASTFSFYLNDINFQSHDGAICPFACCSLRPL